VQYIGSWGSTKVDSIFVRLCMHHVKNLLINLPLSMTRTRKTAHKSTGPFGVPRHQLAPRHEGSSSGSNDPIGDLEAKVEQLWSELRHQNRAWARTTSVYLNCQLTSAACNMRFQNRIGPLIGPSTRVRSLGTAKQKLELVW
jgi:hypothetical protein